MSTILDFFPKKEAGSDQEPMTTPAGPSGGTAQAAEPEMAEPPTASPNQAAEPATATPAAKRVCAGRATLPTDAPTPAPVENGRASEVRQLPSLASTGEGHCLAGWVAAHAMRGSLLVDIKMSQQTVWCRAKVRVPPSRDELVQVQSADSLPPALYPLHRPALHLDPLDPNLEWEGEPTPTSFNHIVQAVPETDGAPPINWPEDVPHTHEAWRDRLAQLVAAGVLTDTDVSSVRLGVAHARAERDREDMRRDRSALEQQPRGVRSLLLLCIRVNVADVVWPDEAAGRVLRWAAGVEFCRLTWPTVHRASWSTRFVSRVVPAAPTHRFGGVAIEPGYSRTLVEPLGQISACVRLQASKLGKFGGSVSAWLAAANSATTLSAGSASSEALVMEGDGSDDAELVTFLLKHPKSFKLRLELPEPLVSLSPPPPECDGGAVVEQPCVWLRVEVALRPRVFSHCEDSLLAVSEDSLQQLFAALGHEVQLPDEPPKIKIARPRPPPLSVHKQSKAALAHKAGDLCNRLLEAIEAVSSERTAEAPSPPALKATLRPFQRRALAWMLEHELRGWPPSFTRLVPVGADGSSAAKPPRALYYSSDGVFSARRPATGGLLALEMGMGKTVVALALVLANPAPHGAPRGTLVVVPTTLLGGWKTETAKLLPKRLKARFARARALRRLPGAHALQPRQVLVLDSAAKKRLENQPRQLLQFDVVITTYHLLEATDEEVSFDRHGDEFVRRARRSPALETAWHRVIFDESQWVKSTSAELTRHAARLDAPRRWCLSGTPMPNSIHDLEGQFHALRLEPFDCLAPGNASHFFRSRLDPNSNQQWMMQLGRSGQSEQPLLRVLSAHMLRQTKAGEAASGTADEATLPPVTTENLLLEPSADEASHYRMLHEAIQAAVAKWERAGDLGAQVARLSGALLRLRMACDHPTLARDAMRRMEEATEELKRLARESSIPVHSVDDVLRRAQRDQQLHGWLARLLGPLLPDGAGPAAEEAAECCICMDEICLPTLTPCKRPHMFCLACLLDVMSKSGADTANGRGRSGKCPICRTVCHEKDLRRLRVPTAGEPAAAAATAADVAAGTRGVAGAGAGVAGAGGAEGGAPPAATMRDGSEAPRGSKLDALVAALRSQTDEHPQSLVFSQFVAMQRLVAQRLEAEGIRYVQVTGHTSQPERIRALRTFTSDPSVAVFLLGLRSAAVGLTLTCASRVFLLEPCLSLALEKQAIGRVHRHGQARPVAVVRLALRGTVEERLLCMHAAPRRAATGALTEFLDMSRAPLLAKQAADADKAEEQQSLDVPTLRRLLV